MTGAPRVVLKRVGSWSRGAEAGYVFVICQDWDYYHDEYTEGEADLGPDGLAYYALYGNSEDLGSASSRSPTCLTEQEAVARAEALVGPVEWSRPLEDR